MRNFIHWNISNCEHVFYFLFIFTMSLTKSKLNSFGDYCILWLLYLLHKLKSYWISGQIFCIISSFLSNRWLPVVLDGKSSQEYPVNAGVPQGSILGSTVFLLYINVSTFLMMFSVILVSMLMIPLSKCDQASDQWQQLQLASELESDLWDTVD